MKSFAVYFTVFLLATVESCIYDSDCPSGSFDPRYCCGGQCTYGQCYNGYCTLNSDCPGPTIHCCDDTNVCAEDESECPLGPGTIIGIVVGVLIVIGGIATLISCCVCTSCPLHPSRRSSPGHIYNTRQPSYQAIGNTAVTTTTHYQGVYPQPNQNPYQHGGQPYQQQQTSIYNNAPPPQYTV